MASEDVGCDHYTKSGHRFGCVGFEQERDVTLTGFTEPCALLYGELSDKSKGAVPELPRRLSEGPRPEMTVTGIGRH